MWQSAGLWFYSKMNKCSQHLTKMLVLSCPVTRVTSACMESTRQVGVCWMETLTLEQEATAGSWRKQWHRLPVIKTVLLSGVMNLWNFLTWSGGGGGGVSIIAERLQERESGLATPTSIRLSGSAYMQSKCAPGWPVPPTGVNTVVPQCWRKRSAQRRLAWSSAVFVK